MRFSLRKSTDDTTFQPSTATPEQLLDEVRLAQEQHAAAIASANERLIDDHTGIYAEADNRQAILEEQITLLQAEAQGLDKVKVAARTNSRF